MRKSVGWSEMSRNEKLLLVLAPLALVVFAFLAVTAGIWLS